jgi:hypothetical protein
MAWTHSRKTNNILKYTRGVFYEDSNHIILKIGVNFIRIPVLTLCIFLVPELADAVIDFIENKYVNCDLINIKWRAKTVVNSHAIIVVNYIICTSKRNPLAYFVQAFFSV